MLSNCWALTGAGVSSIPGIPWRPVSSPQAVLRATNDGEKTNDDGTKTRTEAVVVVARALPCRKAVPQEVIVALALRALEHLGDDGQPLVGGRDLLHMGFNLPVGGLLADRGSLLLVILGIVGNKDLAGLVGMEVARLLAESLGQLVLGRAGLDAEEVVEGDVLAFGLDHLVAETEDFMIWCKLSAKQAVVNCSCASGRQVANVATSGHLKHSAIA